MFFKDYPLALRTPFKLGNYTLKQIQGDIDPTPSNAYPVERDIVTFYSLIALLNHRFTSPFQTVDARDAEVIAEVDRLLAPTLRRLINYLCVVCLRECRHYKKFPVKGATDQWNEAVSGIKGSEGTSCVKTCYKEADLNTMPLQEVLEGASACFGSGYWGGAFGGKAWKTISDHTLRFVSGEISAEVFIDQAFSLQHNTSTVFNKSVIYQHASQDKVHNLLELQAHGYLGLALADHGIIAVRDLIEKHHPDFLTPDLDKAPSDLKYILPAYTSKPVSSPTKTPVEASKVLWTSFEPVKDTSQDKQFVFLNSTVTVTEKQRESVTETKKTPTLKVIPVNQS